MRPLGAQAVAGYDPPALGYFAPCWCAEQVTYAHQRRPGRRVGGACTRRLCITTNGGHTAGRVRWVGRRLDNSPSVACSCRIVSTPSGRSVIERADDPEGAAGEDVRVDHHRAYVLLPEERLHRADVNSGVHRPSSALASSGASTMGTRARGRRTRARRVLGPSCRD